MSAHVNPPWKSFLLFLLVGGVAWAGYEGLYVRRIFASTGEGELLSRDQRDQVRERILARYANDGCFVEVRGNINWRVHDDYYRIDILVADGCEDRAKVICREITEAIDEEYKVRSSVWAFDASGRLITSVVK